MLTTVTTPEECLRYVESAELGLLTRVIALLRARFPHIDITLRADGGLGHEEVLTFCEKQELAYVLGLPSNPRLRSLSSQLEAEVVAFAAQEGADAIAYTGLAYQAGTWPSERQVVCKAETLLGQLNVRSVVCDRLNETAEDTYLFYCERAEHIVSAQNRRTALRR